MQIEILHHRDPDSSCELTVFIDGQPVTDYVVEDIDPGAGYSRAEWNQRRDVVHQVGYSPAFTAAFLEALGDAGDSPYIDDDYDDEEED